METFPQVEDLGTVPRDIIIQHTDSQLQMGVKSLCVVLQVCGFIPQFSKKCHFSVVNQGAEPRVLLNCSTNENFEMWRDGKMERALLLRGMRVKVGMNLLESQSLGHNELLNALIPRE